MSFTKKSKKLCKLAAKIIASPIREFILIALIAGAFSFSYFFPDYRLPVLLAALLGSLATFWQAFRVLLFERRVSIETFNSAALIVSFVTAEFSSAAFIALMLLFAELLEWNTRTRSSRAIEELLKLKPLKAFREKGGEKEEVLAEDIKKGDVIVVESGARIPVDGVVIFGGASVNESSVTGESLPAQKTIGDKVFGSTLNESGILKVRAERVGKESTLERMVELMKKAAENKSRPEKIADKFAALFLPVVALAGAATYFLSGNVSMTVAIFLVACADDIAVAIPLAMTAAIGRAAKRGVIIKGGEWLDVLSKMRTLVLDKTGTLTYGVFSVRDVKIEPGVSENEFWQSAAVAEKFSEHAVARAIFREAMKRVGEIPDPDEFKVYGGSGVIAKHGNNEIVIGDESILVPAGISESAIKDKYKDLFAAGRAKAYAFLNKKLIGAFVLDDIPRPEAAESVKKLTDIGVKRIIMFTGDNPRVAADVARALGIKEFRASMSPEEKLLALEAVEEESGPVGMVGDGINDAPALARANIGIAMGGTGTAVAVEAADAIILPDDLGRISEIILLGRKTLSVIKGDIVIWFFSNAIGFALVFSGVFGPALAAFYNFITDFLPLINSARLFREK